RKAPRASGRQAAAIAFPAGKRLPEGGGGARIFAKRLISYAPLNHRPLPEGEGVLSFTGARHRRGRNLAGQCRLALRTSEAWRSCCCVLAAAPRRRFRWLSRPAPRWL